jgi:hypothetical protein
MHDIVCSIPRHGTSCTPDWRATPEPPPRTHIRCSQITTRVPSTAKQFKGRGRLLAASADQLRVGANVDLMRRAVDQRTFAYVPICQRFPPGDNVPGDVCRFESGVASATTGALCHERVAALAARPLVSASDRPPRDQRWQISSGRHLLRRQRPRPLPHQGYRPRRPRSHPRRPRRRPAHQTL